MRAYDHERSVRIHSDLYLASHFYFKSQPAWHLAILLYCSEIIFQPEQTHTREGRNQETTNKTCIPVCTGMAQQQATVPMKFSAYDSWTKVHWMREKSAVISAKEYEDEILIFTPAYGLLHSSLLPLPALMAYASPARASPAIASQLLCVVTHSWLERSCARAPKRPRAP